MAHVISLPELLRQALIEQWQTGCPAPHTWVGMQLEPLQAKGLAHDHVRLLGTGWLARIPKQSQMRLEATDNLNHQRACFGRASMTGHTPQCLHLLQPCPQLPRGALIVQEIAGRAALLPQDLPLVAASMAAMHRMPLPEPDQRLPLINACDPLHAMWDDIAEQARFLPQAGLATGVVAKIQTEMSRFHALCRQTDRPQRRLIAFDSHPGNFVITQAGCAYLVDLEKCRYSYPGFDLAHATLYTSTTWDVASHAMLKPEEVVSAYRAWGEHVDTDLARDAKRWHLPLRRAMWLWSVTWCAKWRISSAAPPSVSNGEDWSAQNIESGLADHVRERVDHYLSRAGVEWVCEEFDALAAHWGEA